MATPVPTTQEYLQYPDTLSAQEPSTAKKRRPEEVARERVMILLALVALTPLVLKAVDLPGRNIAISFLGSALSVRLTTSSLLLVMLPALVCAGTDWVLRAHPEVRSGAVAFVFPFWIAPGFTALLLALLLTRIPVWPVWVMALLAGIFILALLILAEYSAIAAGDAGYAIARLALTAITYLIAFGLLVLVYGTRERSVITATLTFTTIFGLALDLMSPHIIGLRKAAVYAFVAAFITAQMMWALNYWNISNWSAGVLLLAVFYLLIGLAQQRFQDRITGPVLVEFTVVAAIALLAAAMLANVR